MFTEMARLARFERATFPLGGERSIQLSYKRMRQCMVASVGLEPT